MYPVSARHGNGRLAAAVAGTAIILVLTSCTGAPNTPPSSSATAPATTSGTVTSVSTAPGTTASPTVALPVYKPADASGPAQNVPLPVKPPLADEFSKAGIEAFARYWYDTLSYAFETGEMSPLESISDPGCIPCARTKAGVVPWHQEGRWTVGGQMIVDGTQSSFERTPEGFFQAVTSVKQASISYFDADGMLIEKKPPTAAIADIVVAGHRDGHWTAMTVEHLGAN
ncbi:DUF6318 family protein [Arthrobacter sp. H14-L1]|nr:DUF6318 family protein [Arthrobacter sp. H14-L1]